MSRAIVTMSLLALALAGTPRLAAAQAPAGTAAGDRTLLDRYCVTCHNERLQTAGLALDAVDVERVAEHAAVLEKVVRKLRSGQMPPAGRPQPDAAVVDTFVTALETALDRESEAAPNPGRVASRRLNRVEYVNAIQDLLALEVNGAELLPSDMAGFGFDNNADVLAMTPSLMTRYIAAATKVSRAAIGSLDNRPMMQVYEVGFEERDVRVSEDMPFSTLGGLSERHMFPLNGEYVFAVRLKRNATVETIEGIEEDEHEIELRVDHKLVTRWRIGGQFSGPDPGVLIAVPEDDVDGQRLHEYRMTADDALEIRVPIEAGQRLVSVAFTDSAPSPHGLRGKPGIDKLFISGPFEGSVPDQTASRQRIFTCHPAGDAAATVKEDCAREIITTLARRAYRRPVTDADVEPLVAVYRDGNAERDFDFGIELALEALLSMPEFLMRIYEEPTDLAPGEPYRLSDLELASRLSFFLWRSIPDDELIDLAADQRLSDPDVLTGQIQRMLEDDRATRFLDDFVGQWLQIRNINEQAPDGALFAQFNDTLRRAMVEETQLFFESQVRSDQPIQELLTADYSYLNEQLARHYGVDNIYGSRFRRVTLEDDRRHGLLGHASLLDGYFVRQPDIGGAARQVGARDAARRAAAAAAAQRPAAGGGRGRGRPDVAAREDGATPAQPGLRHLPHRDGPARFRDGAFRRESASGARRTAARQSTQPSTGPGAHHRQPASIPRGARRQGQRVRADGDREAADLCDRPRRRLLRRTHHPADRGECGESGLPLVGYHRRSRHQPAVPDAAFRQSGRRPGRDRGCRCGQLNPGTNATQTREGQSHGHHQDATAAANRTPGPRRQHGAATARQHGAGADRAEQDCRCGPCAGSASSTSRTGCRCPTGRRGLKARLPSCRRPCARWPVSKTAC